MTKYASKLESKFAALLKKKKGVTVAYESVRLPYTLSKFYLPDFVVHKRNGEVFYIEIKGYLRPADRTKMLAVRQAAPGIDIRFIFAKDNKISSLSSTRYSDWCKRHHFEYSIGSLPNAWFE